MSRSGYSDDNENIAMWRGMVASAIRGKRGQQFLKELIASLEAMPEKKLIKNELVTATGEVCALGCVGQARGLDMTKFDPDEDPEFLAEQLGKAFNIAPCLAQEVQYLNDEWNYSWTPEQRWAAVHKWAQENLKEDAS